MTKPTMPLKPMNYLATIIMSIGLLMWLQSCVEADMRTVSIIEQCVHESSTFCGE